MSLSDNPYILVMLFSSLAAAFSGLAVAWINGRNDRRKSGGTIGSADAATIFNQGIQNYQGAITLVKELRTELDRLTKKVTDQDNIIDAQDQEIETLKRKIHELEVTKCSIEDCDRRVQEITKK